MDFSFSTENQALQQLAAKVFATPRDKWPAELERAGLLALEEASFVDLCLILEQAGRAGASTDIAAVLFGAYAAGAHATYGTIIFAPNLAIVPFAERADRVLVVEGDGVFLAVPHRTARQLATDDTTRHTITYDHAERIGEAAPLRARWTVALCALELGIAQQQLATTAEYVVRRQQFGKPIGTFQAVAQRAGDMYIDVESLRLVTWQAAWRLAEGRDAVEEAATAAFFACEAGARIANAAQHLHGGMGFDRAYPLYRYYLAAKQLELELGGANRTLAQLGAHLATRTEATE